MTMIATVIQRFWLPIVVVIAMVIYAIRAARRLDSLDDRDKKVIDRESAASGHTRPPRSVTARIIVGVSAFAFILLIQYSPRLALVHAANMDYLIVAIIAGAIVFARVRLREGLGVSPRPPLSSLALWFVVAAYGVSGVLLLANALLDRGPAREFTTVVAGEYCGRRSGSEITVRGAPALPVVAGTMDVNVRTSMCRAARAGDTVVVLIGPGYFGRAWVQGARPVQTAQQ
jgi:hypothetical protein